MCPTASVVDAVLSSAVLSTAAASAAAVSEGPGRCWRWQRWNFAHGSSRQRWNWFGQAGRQAAKRSAQGVPDGTGVENVNYCCWNL